MKFDDVKLLKNIKYRPLANDIIYRYTSGIRDISISPDENQEYHPVCLSYDEQDKGFYLYDYTQIVQECHDRQRYSSLYTADQFLSQTSYKVRCFEINTISAEMAQKIINENIVAFRELSAKIVEQEIVKQLEKI